MHSIASGAASPLTLNGAYYSLVSGIALPAVSVVGLFSFLGPRPPDSILPAVAILACILASIIGLTLGVVAAVRAPHLRGIGVFGAVLHALYLVGLATFQIVLLTTISRG